MKAELTGVTFYYAVEKDGKDYTVVKSWDSNSDSSDYEVTALDEDEVPEDLRTELINSLPAKEIFTLVKEVK